MSKYITDIQVSRGRDDEQSLQNRGFMKINVILNKTAFGEAVYVWYKNDGDAITKVQVSFNRDMSEGLTNTGYTQVDQPITGGNFGVNLWYYQSTDVCDAKIVELDVTTNPDDEAKMISLGSWERAGCNLSEVRGQWVYLWVKREKQTYICGVQGTVSYGTDKELFDRGFIRIDETTNTGNCGSCPNTGRTFIWYQQTTDPTKALTDVKVSITDEQRQQYLQQGYTPVDVSLNPGSVTNPVYVWYKQGGPSPIKNMQLLLNQSAVTAYEKAGANIIHGNLNVGHDGGPRSLCVYNRK